MFAYLSLGSLCGVVLIYMGARPLRPGARSVRHAFGIVEWAVGCPARTIGGRLVMEIAAPIFPPLKAPL